MHRRGVHNKGDEKLKTTTIPAAIKRLLVHAQDSLDSDPNMWNDYDQDLVTAMRCVTKTCHDDQVYVHDLKRQLEEKQRRIDELSNYLASLATGANVMASRHRSPPPRHDIKIRSQTALPIDKCV